MFIQRDADAFDAAPALNKTISLELPVGEAMRFDALLLEGVGYSNTNQELDLAAVVDEIQVYQDTIKKCRINLTLQRIYDELHNANADGLDKSVYIIPFNRYLDPEGGWGFDGIGACTIKVKFLSAFPANTSITDLQGMLIYHPQAVKQPRGNAFMLDLFDKVDVKAGWNEIKDVQPDDGWSVSKIIMNAANITAVEVWLGPKLIYQANKKKALAILKQNPLFKVPSSITYTNVAGQAVTSTGAFPIILDLFAVIGDNVGLFVNGVRQRFKIKFYVDTTISAAAAFTSLIEYRERDLKQVLGSAQAQG